MTHEINVPADLFVTQVCTLLSHFSEEAVVTDILKLDIAYTKLHVKYRLLVARKDIKSFEDLTRECKRVEGLWRDAVVLASIPNAIVAPPVKQNQPITQRNNNSQTFNQNGFFP